MITKRTYARFGDQVFFIFVAIFLGILSLHIPCKCLWLRIWVLLLFTSFPLMIACRSEFRAYYLAVYEPDASWSRKLMASPHLVRDVKTYPYKWVVVIHYTFLAFFIISLLAVLIWGIAHK